MNKKYSFYFFLVLVLVSLFLGAFLFKSCSDDEDGDTLPAMFAFEDNLAVKYTTAPSISIDVFTQDIQKMEVLINDSVIKTWSKPKKKVDFSINSLELGVGAKKLDLRTTYANGKVYTDERLLRVLSDLKPENWTVSIISTLSHNTENFTQGLEFDGNQLYESTGQQGQSKVAKIDLANGSDIIKIGLDATYFGEGITIVGETLYQLTWTSGKCFLYDKNTLQPQQKEFTYSGEGWGLCNNEKQIIMSDGTERITFRNPKTFRVERTIEVYTDNDAVVNLNELEYIDGFIYANIWMTNKIVVIEPETGRVVAFFDGSELVQQGRGARGDSFNGIAYNKQTEKIYLTGKNWEKMFEVKLSKPTS